MPLRRLQALVLLIACVQAHRGDSDGTQAQSLLELQSSSNSAVQVTTATLLADCDVEKLPSHANKTVAWMQQCVDTLHKFYAQAKQMESTSRDANKRYAGDMQLVLTLLRSLQDRVGLHSGNFEAFRDEEKNTVHQLLGKVNGTAFKANAPTSSGSMMQSVENATRRDDASHVEFVSADTNSSNAGNEEIATHLHVGSKAAGSLHQRQRRARKAHPRRHHISEQRTAETMADSSPAGAPFVAGDSKLTASTDLSVNTPLADSRKSGPDSLVAVSSQPLGAAAPLEAGVAIHQAERTPREGAAAREEAARSPTETQPTLPSREEPSVDDSYMRRKKDALAAFLRQTILDGLRDEKASSLASSVLHGNEDDDAWWNHVAPEATADMLPTPAAAMQAAAPHDDSSGSQAAFEDAMDQVRSLFPIKRISPQSS
mmetsp:Transcript_68487/g.164475  ORF Transcript_68487/g.164475 Transcript_68487/m.164475 type:complete len:429 (+) Transcript_68487:174-1460(+)